MEQRKTAGRGMAMLLSAALVPTVGVPAAAFADEGSSVQEQAAAGHEAFERANVVDEMMVQDAADPMREGAGQVDADQAIASEMSVSTQEQLRAAIDSNEVTKITLASDIVMTDEWVPARIESGRVLVVDGAGHTISGMVATKSLQGPNGTGIAGDGGSSDYYCGFIGDTSGTVTIQNLTFSRAEVDIKPVAADKRSTGSSILGTVVGNNNGKLVLNNVAVDSSVVRGYSKVGGLVGFSQNGGTAEINRCAVRNSEVVLEADGTDPEACFSGVVVGYDGNKATKTNGVALEGNTTTVDGSVKWGADVQTDELGTRFVSAYGGRYGLTCETYAKDPSGVDAVPMPFDVDGYRYESMNDAFAAAQDGDTVRLLQDIVLSDTLSVSNGGKIAFDIAGHTAAIDRSRPFNAFKVVGATTLSVFDSSSDNSGSIELGNEKNAFIVGPGATLDIRDVSINLNNPSGKRTTSVVQSQGNLVVGAGASIEAGCIGFTAIGSESSLLVEDGAKAITYNQVISGNGQQRYGGTRIVVDGGELVSTDAAAVYHPQAGSLVLNGGYLEGAVGVQLCAGSLDVPADSAVEVVATDPDDRGSDAGDGVVFDGAALSVIDRDGYADIEKTVVAGGSFLSRQGEALLAYGWKDGAEVEWPESVAALQIVGGSYSSDPSEFVPDGYDVVRSGDVWTVSEHAEPDVDIEVEHRPDGSTVTTETRPDGSQTVTTETSDGTSSLVEKDAEGNVVSTEVSVSDAAAGTGKVDLPIDAVKPAPDAGNASIIEVEVPASVTADAPVKVSVPTAKADGGVPNQGVVVVAVDAEGNERVLPKCAVDAEGNVAFEATGDVTVKIVDASPSFPDIDGTWYDGDGTADFVGSRAILTGMPQADGSLLFDGDAATTRAMFVTMLHRLESEPVPAASEDFDDIDGDWFADAATWGHETGIVRGYNDEPVFGGDDVVSREQIAVFAMRYAQWLGLDTSARADLSAFVDADAVSPFAYDAVRWAVAEGILRGHADGSQRFDPMGGATRAEASAVVMRLVDFVLG